MIHTFYINEENLDDTKLFIRTLPSARFNGNPLKVGNKYNLSVDLEVKDGNKLSQYLEQYYESNDVDQTIQVPFYKRVFNFIMYMYGSK